MGTERLLRSLKYNHTNESDMVRLEVTEEDFEGFRKAKSIREGIGEKILDEFRMSNKQRKARDGVLALLPMVVAKKVNKSVPHGFKLDSIQLTFEVSGEPFGVGVKGDVEVTFKRQAKRKTK